MNDASNVQQKILSTFYYSLSNVVNVKNKKSNPDKVKTIKAGKVMKTGDDWLVVEKADVELC